MKPSLWFNQARYGMFIHWGAYSVAARGEWVRNRERIPQAEYRRLYAENFRAESYDPRRWAELALDAGMRYAVLTVRHHDGFALWPTETSDFHAGNLGPRRDLVGPYVEAFRAVGLKVGFYYSPADWSHPDYPGAYYRDWPDDADWKNEESRLRFIAYYREQLRELLTHYGAIDYLWYDGCIPNNLQSREANEEVLRLQPDILINERNGDPYHVHISEQAIKPCQVGTDWEACLTLNNNWGWHAGDAHWKSASQIVEMLTETAAAAGNLLLNVGPKPDGTIPEESVRILKAAGSWLHRNGESIYGSDRSPFTWSNWGRITVKGNRIFLHIWNSTGSELCLSEIKNRVRSVRYLSHGAELPFTQDGECLLISGLQVPLPDPLATTIAIEVEGIPEPITKQTSFWIPGEKAA